MFMYKVYMSVYMSVYRTAVSVTFTGKTSDLPVTYLVELLAAMEVFICIYIHIYAIIFIHI
jgi:hypothetical protein